MGDKKMQLAVKEVEKRSYNEDGKLVYVETYTPVEHVVGKRIAIGAGIIGAGILGYVIGAAINGNFSGGCGEEDDDE